MNKECKIYINSWPKLERAFIQCSLKQRYPSEMLCSEQLTYLSNAKNILKLSKLKSWLAHIIFHFKGLFITQTTPRHHCSMTSSWIPLNEPVILINPFVLQESFIFSLMRIISSLSHLASGNNNSIQTNVEPNLSYVLLDWKCNFPMNPHVPLLVSWMIVGLLKSR